MCVYIDIRDVFSYILLLERILEADLLGGNVLGQAVTSEPRGGRWGVLYLQSKQNFRRS